MQQVTVWTKDKEDFLLSIRDGSWYVTKDNRLMDEMEFENAGKPRAEVKDEFLITILAPHHTADWLREFCEEHHPEVNFDKEFNTSEPGVFARYQEKFGHDYEEWVSEAQYKALKEAIAKKGYVLPWD